MLYKLKGHKNKNFPMKSSLCPTTDNEHLLSGSEDGDVYLWSNVASTAIAMSKKNIFGKLLASNKTGSCEHFNVFPTKGGKGGVSAAIFAPH